MLKFLRKYNKIILVVGGCFLMVAFLLPTALTQGGGMQNPKVVRIGDHVVRAKEYGSASAKVQLYENLNILSGFIDRKENPVQHWLMLLHAAREGGFVGGPTDGAEVLNTYLSPQDRDVIIQRIGADAAYEALAEWRGVVRMLSTYTGAGRLSEAEAQLLALELFDEAQVNVAVLKPEVVEGVSEPTEEEILAHLRSTRTSSAGRASSGSATGSMRRFNCAGSPLSACGWRARCSRTPSKSASAGRATARDTRASSTRSAGTSSGRSVTSRSRS